jgi:hypothetical protein
MRGVVMLAAGALALAACGERTHEVAPLRLSTKSYRFTLSPKPVPPYANEDIHYTITVIDRTTGQPVQGGEGQLYGQLTPEKRPYTYDGLAYGPEVGTYHAKLRFVIATSAGNPGEAWQMGLRFRRDSLSPIEVINWSQQVRPERGFSSSSDSVRR